LSRICDDDVCDFIRGVERDFGVRFARGAFEHCETAGELFDSIVAALPETAKSGGKCPSQMAFYRLRAAIGVPELKPETRLTDIPGFRYVVLERLLRRRGWKAPWRAWTGGFAPAVVIFGAIAAAPWLSDWIGWFWAIMGVLVVALYATQFLHRWVFTSGEAHASTLGELAREFAEINAGKLRVRGASFNRRLLWQRFVDTVSEDARDGPVVRESGFY
jgi:hypothetical protein